MDRFSDVSDAQVAAFWAQSQARDICRTARADAANGLDLPGPVAAAITALQSALGGDDPAQRDGAVTAVLAAWAHHGHAAAAATGDQIADCAAHLFANRSPASPAGDPLQSAVDDIRRTVTWLAESVERGNQAGWRPLATALHDLATAPDDDPLGYARSAQAFLDALPATVPKETLLAAACLARAIEVVAGPLDELD